MTLVAIGLLIVSGAIILLEIALTRVFAIMLWHHLTYMVISIALLGFGAAGTILTIRRAAVGGAPVERALATLSAAFGLSVVAAFFGATSVPVDTLSIWKDQLNVLSLGLLYGIVFVPFLLGGATVGLALTRLASQVDRLYFFDLVGSALGGFASVWLLARVGSSASVLTSGVLGALAALVFSLRAPRRQRALAAVAVLVTSVVWLASVTGTLVWHVPFAPGKEFATQKMDPGGVTRLWSATAEVQVGPKRELPPFLGGEFANQSLRFVEGRVVGQDGTAPTMLYSGASDLDAFGFLDKSSTGVALVAHRARGGVAPRVLVIGVGGGVDVMIALAADASHVTAVEINQAMIDMVQQHFDEELGGLFRPGAHPWSDRVELVRGEGRAFVRASDERYDNIQLSGVDSFTALTTGAYTLSEGYLYTVEAVRDFYEHLAPGGYVVYSRFIMRPPRRPRETLRLANIARQAMSELGVADPASQMMIVRGYEWASTVIKRGPFTPQEVAAVHEYVRENDFWGVVFDPLRGPADPWPHTRSPAPGLREAFHTVLRGSDEERERFIAGYPYDLRPSRDDAPFFFSYYRYGEALRGVLAGDWDMKIVERYSPDFPVGHAILLASLAQITLAAALLILLPLRALRDAGTAGTGSRLRIFGYFAALGAGFMLLEIALMQKMVLFLGHPVYAVTVVLTTLLLAAGVGSLVSGRIADASGRVLQRLLPAVVGVILLVTAAVSWLLPALLGWAFPLRVAAAIGLLLPLGVLLGMPFPIGIRIVAARAPELLPWAWGINGFLSVFASIFCIVLAMWIGFSRVLIVAACIYAAGLWLLVPRAAARRA